MSIPFTSKISRDFSRAANTYDANAILQRQVADKLFSLFAIQNGITLDIGCGTGYFHELLRKNKIYQPLIQTDIAYAMCKIANTYASPPQYGGTYTCTSDMHNLPFADEEFSNIFSSMTIQWAEDLEKVFSEIKRTLKKNGQFAISLVAGGSMPELIESFLGAGRTPHIHNFVENDDVYLALANSGLVIKDFLFEKITLHHTNIYHMMKSIKGVGASYKGPQKNGIKGKGYFKSIEEIYRTKFGNENGLPLSWNIIYITGNK